MLCTGIRWAIMTTRVGCNEKVKMGFHAVGLTILNMMEL